VVAAPVVVESIANRKGYPVADEGTAFERRRVDVVRRRAVRVIGGLITAFAIASLTVGADGHSQPRTLFSPIFQDHAVLQRDRPISVWGGAAPGEQVSVTLNGRQASARADRSGRWEAMLPEMSAGGPYTLEVRAESGATQTILDILVGDVWLCSGQSNMELSVLRSRNGDLAVNRSANDGIRLLTIAHLARSEPAREYEPPVTWQPAGPQTVRNFSATCYYFARELQESVQVPMGLINASWGGSAIEAWISDPGLRAVGGFDDRLDLLRLYVRDTDAANQRLGRTWEEWWRAHAPAAGEPWRPGPAAAGGWRDVPEPMRDWKKWGVPDLANHDGMVWFRRAFHLTPEQSAQAATLSLGGIDEVDETWVNGRVIRNTFGWGTERVYRLPAGILRAGDNTVVVNVLSTWDAGGMVGPEDRLALGFDDGTKVSLAGNWRYQVVPLSMGSPPRAPWEPIAGLTTLYNGMIAPLGPYGLRGVVWYQGESNTNAAAQYQALLAGLMSSWRGQFGAALPFLVVQLPGFGPVPTSPVESGWADVRDAQRRAVASDGHAGLAVTIDLGERGDIHPTNKRDVGSRLVRAARRVVYGEAITPSGPVPLSARREPGRVVVTFGDVEGRFVTYSASQAIGFELCGAEKDSCRFASGTVEADRVVLPLGSAPTPTRVRFCWGDSPFCNLSDRTGLPVGPFEIPIR
jgi:sialate O-acetylesterase